MKYFLILGGFLLIASSHANAGNECDSMNMYERQACEVLKQSSQNVQKKQADSYQQQVNKNKEALEKQIMESKKSSSPPVIKEVPAWQKSLNPPVAVQNPNEEVRSASSGDTSEINTDTVRLAPLPPPAPTEFVSPKSINVQGVTIIPKDSGKNTGVSKYP